MQRQRHRLEASGTVQGIGLRPFVLRLAREEAVVGFVRNDGGVAVIEAEGSPEQLARFAERFARELPAPGRIAELCVTALEPQHDSAFVITESARAERPRGGLAPDGFVCGACLAELRDPHDRRHRHPFISCAQCGPRLTITRALPYDRPTTTLARFPLCESCAREHRDPYDRRFHAQTISCPACGPVLWLCEPGGDATPPRQRAVNPAAAIAGAQRVLQQGGVLAVRGVGGFHLAVDARNEAAVQRLRDAKQRPRKPLAVMVRDLETACGVAALDPVGEALLSSYAAPIVLVTARPGALAPGIAPGLDEVGLFLPYTGAHHLLLEGPLDAVVLTSGNAAGEPITTANDVALCELPADAFLLHDRDIEVACDDSVVRPLDAGAAVFVRRARGYVPVSLPVPALPRRRVLALGAELKVTIATLCDGELALGRHLGDLDNLAAEEAFAAEVARLLAFSPIDPEIIAVDLHPDLHSTRYAELAFAGLPLARVQHHHAHFAAVLVEHGVTPDVRAAGIILDGIGFGDDGTLWGGEVLVGSYAHVERIAHLRAVAQPGGDRAAREPWRMATSLLADAGLEAHPAFDARLAEVARVRSLSPLTSSAGRLFDGVAALLGVAPAVQDYDGEAAALLERAVDAGVDDAYPLPMNGGVLDTRVLVRALLEDRAALGVRAARFHNGLADALADAALATGASVVALGGGAMVNRRLTHRLLSRLTRRGARALVPTFFPPGDGGLSAGQAACAAFRL